MSQLIPWAGALGDPCLAPHTLCLPVQGALQCSQEEPHLAQLLPDSPPELTHRLLWEQTGESPGLGAAGELRLRR